MLHSWDRETFTPVTSSAEIAEILALVPKPWTEFSIHRPGVWMKTFQRAQQLLLERKSDVKNDPVLKTFFTGLIKMVITRDQRFIDLVEKYFDLEDVVEIMQRMIGTGLIGGKSLGMLLARAIIKKNRFGIK
ncbi:MAG: hypothetical protein ACP5MG_09695 [Verrucomicrobiia bacterium]|jgi:hypothetical protein